MKSSPLNLQISLQKSTYLTNPTPKSPFLIPTKTTTHASRFSSSPARITCICRITKQLMKTTKTSNPFILELKPRCQKLSETESELFSSNGYSRYVVLGTVYIGFVLFLMGFDDHNKALAFGPEGPLVEEFWDNVRRYALYALTVSTGAIYTIFQPIFELLKNPISAILILAIFGGSIYIVSQVLSAMVGVTEFNYDYGY